MVYKWIGAMMITLGCGGFGLSLAMTHRREEVSLRQLIAALDYMECELQFRLTPLPDLCRQAGHESGGKLRDVLLALSQELERQISPDVCSCMSAALASVPDLPLHTKENLQTLGSSLGRFDLSGQLTGLEAVRTSCRNTLEELGNNRDARLRSYQTLGLCGGAALAILFI